MSDAEATSSSTPAEPRDPTRSAGLAGQALENLVNQFARPLDFLRELVQNAIDAGTQRVDVSLYYRRAEASADPDGVLEIHVDDWGEGMDEKIIDSQLTRLFASTKEDDLTKIGKFGIGFTSIFAIKPDAVLLRTGRHGESWELLFHPDRSFDKTRLDVPVAGTQITLFKRMPRLEVDHFVRESRWILHFWCEHSDTPINFWDRTQQVVTAAPTQSDPFAAFTQATPARLPASLAQVSAAQASAGPAGVQERINSPLAVDADLSVTLDEDGVTVVVGLAEEPRYGFYNGGLTLMNTENEDVLGEHRYRLRHLRFKVKSDTLEHTLTRDSVLQDQHWLQAISVLQRAVGLLQLALLERLAQAVASDEPLELWHGYLATECLTSAVHVTLAKARTTPIFRTHDRQALSLTELEAAYQQHDATLLFPGPGSLARALASQGVPLLDDHLQLQSLLQATWRPPFFSWGKRKRRVVSAAQIFVLPQPVAADALGPQERRLLRDCAALLAHAVTGRLDLQLANFPGGATEALVVEASSEHGLSRRQLSPWRWLPRRLHRRRLLLNHDHPYLIAQVVLAGERPAVAAFGLAQAVLEREGSEDEDAYQRVVAQVSGGLQ